MPIMVEETTQLFANVVISSTGTDIYSCISAAIGSLKGPKHGVPTVKLPICLKLSSMRLDLQQIN